MLLPFFVGRGGWFARWWWGEGRNGSRRRRRRRSGSGVVRVLPKIVSKKQAAFLPRASRALFSAADCWLVGRGGWNGDGVV